MLTPASPTARLGLPSEQMSCVRARVPAVPVAFKRSGRVEFCPVTLKHRKRRVLGPQAQHARACMADQVSGPEQQFLNHRANSSSLRRVAHGSVEPMQEGQPVHAPCGGHNTITAPPAVLDLDALSPKKKARAFALVQLRPRGADIPRLVSDPGAVTIDSRISAAHNMLFDRAAVVHGECVHVQRHVPAGQHTEVNGIAADPEAQDRSVDALQILVNQCQTSLVAQVVGQSLANEIGHVVGSHLQGERIMRPKLLILMKINSFLTLRSRTTCPLNPSQAPDACRVDCFRAN